MREKFILPNKSTRKRPASGHRLGPCNLHNPSYDFNDALLPIGATYWARLVEQVLGRA